ncbi:MAG TPA: pyrroloquinoline quinone biosynthesis protein PqqE [Nitrospira sp.]|nr:pyrroloquinoline quinone biosynthesis protein PqqE [Nitrospira sp.]
MDKPYTLIAELTYRCPLSCPYCSNPVVYSSRQPLDTQTWMRIFDEAEALGVVQLHLTGGEPLLRDDLVPLIREARRLDLYVNLITSGIPLDRDRLLRLRDAGLDAVQLSFQSTEREEADALAGMAAHERKLAAARWIKEFGLPLTVNVVLHRRNIHRVAEIIELAEEVGAHRLELANVQFAGSALVNRLALLPSREQLAKARAVAEAARSRLGGRMEILFVTPDLYADVPRACMDGWGRRFLVIAPDGAALPCHAAHTIPGLPMAYAVDRSLEEIWERSELFNLFRGEVWMPAPCRTCERRVLDYGGCRCQAFHLAGDAGATDPACRWSPSHSIVQQARDEAARRDMEHLLTPRMLKNCP